MELETLEIFIEANLEKMEEQLAKVTPFVEKTMARMSQITGQEINKTEQNMNVDKGTSRIISQLEKMNSQLTKQFEKLEKTSEQSGANVTKGMSKGFRSGKANISKDVESVINEINAKMGQAKAQQEKLAFLKSKRQGAVSSGDTKGTVQIDEQIARAQAAMTKYHDSAKGLANGIKSEFNTIPQTLDDITNKMAANEGQIESFRARIKALQSEYATQRTPTGNFQKGFTGVRDNKTSLKTGDAIRKQSANMNKLIAENDKLQQAFAQAEDRATALKSVLGSVNTELGETSQRTNTASEGLKKMARNTDTSKSHFSRFGGLFNRVSNSIAHGSKRMISGFGKFGNIFNRNANQVNRGSRSMSSGLGGFSRRLSSIVKQVFVFGLIYKGLRTVGQGLFAALNTNEQFASSLNQIKVNLLTAFYPIYTAVLPAINALMSGIAQVTAYLAQFIAMLFGTTYSAAKQGAAGLQQNIDAMQDTGTAADKTKEKVKKLEAALMGFDEINKIGLDDSGDDDSLTNNPDKQNKPGGGTNFDIPEPATPQWLVDFVEKFKKVLADLFEPIKAAWDKHGQKVIDAFKYALNEIIGLIAAIGKSFMEVWTNGTGEKFVSNLLILLADVLNIIGDIAKAFKDAWNDEGRGTALIQSYFDMWNAILELLHEVALSFRNAWNDDGLGKSIIGNILEILTNINNTIRNFADQFKKAWTEGSRGESIFKTILKIIDGILGNIKNMTRATADWAKQLDFTPLLRSIDGLLKAIQPLTKNIGDGLEWFYKNVLLPLANFTITKLIPSFLDVLSEAIGVVNSVVDALKPLGQWLLDNFLAPIAEWTGGTIVSILKGLADILKIIGDWISEHKEIVENMALILGSFATAWYVVNGAITAWNIVAGIAAGVTTAFGAAVGFLTSPIGIAVAAIGAIIAIGVLLWKNWDTVKEKAGELAEWVGGKWDDIKNWTKEKWDGVTQAIGGAVDGAKDWVSEKWEGIKSATSETWENIKKGTSEKWGNVKDAVTNKAKEIGDATSKKWGEIKDGTSSVWGNVKDSVSNLAGKAKDGAVGAWSTMSSGIGNWMKNIKKDTGDVFDTIVGWAGGLGKKIGDGIKGGVDAVANAAKSIANTLVGGIGAGVNGVIGGINWVLSKVGSSWQISKWNVPKFAKGTDYHMGGPALINDAPGAVFREAVRLPNGEEFIPTGRNVMLNLPRGSKVLNAQKTQETYGNIPQYAGGIGEWFTEKWNGIKASASGLLSSAIESFVNLAGIMEPALSIATGGVSMLASNSLGFIHKKIEQEERRDRIKEMRKANEERIRKMKNKGKENGGLVDRDGFYRLAEGNKQEMVLPLEKPNIAVPLIDKAFELMGIDPSFGSLQLPSLFSDTGSFSSVGASGSSATFEGTGGGLNQSTNAIVQAITSALMGINQTGGNSQPIELTINLGGDEYARHVISEINNYQDKTGKTEINI